jgi:hypothetical protein
MPSTPGYMINTAAVTTIAATITMRAKDEYHQCAVKPMPTIAAMIVGTSSMTFVGVKMSLNIAPLPFSYFRCTSSLPLGQEVPNPRQGRH